MRKFLSLNTPYLMILLFSFIEIILFAFFVALYINWIVLIFF